MEGRDAGTCAIIDRMHRTRTLLLIAVLLSSRSLHAESARRPARRRRGAIVDGMPAGVLYTTATPEPN